MGEKDALPERKINLVYAAYDLKVGGAQDLVKTLALNADKDRYDVTVITLGFHRDAPDEEPLVSEIRDAGVEVVNFRMWGWEHKEERERLIALMRHKKVDVVHSHIGYPMNIWMSRAAREAGVPAVIYSKHETYKEKSFKLRFDDAILYNRYVDLALATSRLTRNHLVYYEMMLPWKVKLVPNPVDTNYFDPSRFSGSGVRKEFGIPSGAPVVGNMCRLVGRKGLYSFVMACASVSKELPGCYFLLVGDGYKADELKDTVTSIGIDNFIFAGTRRDIGELMAAMDVFLFTPHWGEAFPLVMLEAMSMGKAIVASNVCSNNELIEHGVSGLLPAPAKWRKEVSTLNADPLATAVVSLIKEPETAKMYGRQARKSVVERFGIEVVMRKLGNVYEGLLRKKGVYYN